VRRGSSERWTVAGAIVLLVAALSCGGGGSYSTSTPTAGTFTPTPVPGTAGSSPPATAEICSCSPSESAESDFRHAQKHVGLSGPTGQDITVSTVLGWGVTANLAWNAPRTGLETQMFHIAHAYLHFVWLVAGDCDIHMEIADTPDPNAPRMVVETPVEGVFCPARQTLQQQLSARGVPIRTSGFDLQTPLPVDVLGLAFQDYNHPRGTNHVATPWEIHPAIINVLPQ
jgi:hypothetical protein